MPRDPLTQEQIEKWKRLAAEAPESMTEEGTGVTRDSDDSSVEYATVSEAFGAAPFYEAAREAVPALIAEVERLRFERSFLECSNCHAPMTWGHHPKCARYEADGGDHAS